MTVHGPLALALVLVSTVACASPAPASRPPAVIGVIQGVAGEESKLRVHALRGGLEALGYRDGRDFTIEVRALSGNDQERAMELARELIGKGASVLVSGTPTGIDGARKATATIPIVMAGAGTDPVGSGWVESLARPGSNVTGLSLAVPMLPARRLQVLRDAIPGTRRIGLLNDSALGANGPVVLAQLSAGAKDLGLALEVTEARDVNEADAALRKFAAAGISAVHVSVASSLVPIMGDIARIATAQGIGTSFGVLDGVRAGALLAVAPDQADLYRRSAAYIDKILKGARAGDLAVEQPEKIAVVINLKTAQALGITIPPSVLSQATEVIR